MIKIFFCEPTGKLSRRLRRYAAGPCGDQGQNSYHNASVELDEMDCARQASGDLWPHDDPRWPTQCERCAYRFVDADSWQLFHDALYRRGDSGLVAAWRAMPVGAVRDIPWMREYHPECVGPDGRTLECRTPGGDWIIDSVANNCTMPDDTVHKCWVRHGRPEDGTLHVDKVGHTCNAGAGSIATTRWHGFLHNGHLVTC